MKNLIPSLVFLVTGFLLGIMLCSRCSEPKPKIITKTETVTKTDTVYQVVEKHSVVKVPTLIYKEKLSTPEPIDLHYFRAYRDTVHHKNVSVIYDAHVVGFLQAMRIQTILNSPTVIKTINTTVTNTIQPKPFRGLYIGLSVGANKDNFQNISPEVNYVSKKNIIGVGYNIFNGSVSLRINRKVF